MPTDPRLDDGFSEMIVQPPSASIGHNMGPEWLPIGTELEDKIRQHYKTLLERAKELIAKQGAFLKCDTQADLKRSTEYVAQLQEAMTRLNSAVDLEGAPYRTGQGQVRGLLGMPFDDLTAIKKAVEAPMTVYNAKIVREERQKREAEAKAKRDAEDKLKREAAEAEDKARRAREAAQKKIDDDRAKQAAKGVAKPKLPGKAVFAAIEKADAAAAVAKSKRDTADDAGAEAARAVKAAGAKASDLTRSRSPNAVQSGQEFLDVRNIDKDKVDVAKIWPFIKAEAVEQALREYGRVNAAAIKKMIAQQKQPLPGAEFFINLRTNVRR